MYLVVCTVHDQSIVYGQICTLQEWDNMFSLCEVGFLVLLLLLILLEVYQAIVLGKLYFKVGFTTVATL